MASQTKINERNNESFRQINSKIDSLVTHTKMLENQIAQQASSSCRPTGRLLGQPETKPREHFHSEEEADVEKEEEEEDTKAGGGGVVPIVQPRFDQFVPPHQGSGPYGGENDVWVAICGLREEIEELRAEQLRYQASLVSWLNTFFSQFGTWHIRPGQPLDQPGPLGQ